MKKINNTLTFIKNSLNEVPTLLVVFIAMTLFTMNILANKNIAIGSDFLALDTGTTISWIVFLTLDIITKQKGAKTANVISVVCCLLNLFFCFLLFVGSKVPGYWAESYTFAEQADIINLTLNNTVGGTWYVVAMSALSFVVAAFVNNYAFQFVGLIIPKKADGSVGFFIQSLVSTLTGQFVDNMLFSLTVGHFFFGWTLIQCIGCALFTMTVELLIQIVFTPIAYKLISKRKAY